MKWPRSLRKLSRVTRCQLNNCNNRTRVLIVLEMQISPPNHD